jgi:hypothetical protein
MYMHFYSKID